MFEAITSILTFIIFINYLVLSNIIMRDIGICGIIAITFLFYLFILLVIIIIIEIIGFIGWIIL